MQCPICHEELFYEDEYEEVSLDGIVTRVCLECADHIHEEAEYRDYQRQLNDLRYGGCI